MVENIHKNLIPIAIIAAGIIIGGAFLFADQPGGGSGQTIPAQVAAEKAISFINENLVSEGMTASLLKVDEENGVYKLAFTVGDAEYDGHITKNGKIFFIQSFDLDEFAQLNQETENGQVPESQEISKNDRPEVKLFVMTFCPFGNQAEELMMPVADLLGDKADIKLHYVIYSNYATGYPDYCFDQDAKYCSMHGIQELNQGIRELCVQKYQPGLFWDFVKKVNDTCTSQNVDQKWEEAALTIGIDLPKIKDCEKNEALQFLGQDFDLNQMYGVRGSPHLIINGGKYQGERSAEGYKQGICSAFNNPPTECQQDLSGLGTGAPTGGCE